MRKILAGLILIAQTAHASSQPSGLLEGVDPKWRLEGTIQGDQRAVIMPDAKTTRLQGRVRIGFTIDAAGIVEIVGIAATGRNFNSPWTTYYNDNGATDEATLFFRNLYLRKVFGKTTVEAGAFTPENTVGDAGLNAAGWMDGIRVLTTTKLGKIKVVAGSLGDFKQANVFERQFKGNFLEIELERELFDKLLTRSALEYYNERAYVREQLQLDVSVLGDKIIKLFANALLDVQNGKATWELGAEFDVLKTILGKFEKRLEMKVYYSEINEDLLGRSDTISQFYTFGPRKTVHLSGNITKNGSLSWSARGAWGRTDRYDIILTYKVPFKFRR